MIAIVYAPIFLRQFKKLPGAIQDDVEEKIAVFQKNPKERSLWVHKLKGALKGFWSFSVHYSHHIVFQWDDARTAVLLAVGDHDIYK